jgi:hypothetical protein
MSHNSSLTNYKLDAWCLIHGDNIELSFCHWNKNSLGLTHPLQIEYRGP